MRRRYIRIQRPMHAEDMYDTYAYSSFEHIYKNIVLDWIMTGLCCLLVGNVFLNVFLYTGMCSFFYSQNVLSCL